MYFTAAACMNPCRPISNQRTSGPGIQHHTYKVFRSGEHPLND